MNALDIKTYFLEHVSNLGDEEDVRYGDPQAEIRGILVCWMATIDAIEKAAEEECNLIIAHEDLFFPYEHRGRPETFLRWTVNRSRIELLAKHNITVFRAHVTLDEMCVLDDFLCAMGMPEPIVSEGHFRVCEVEETSVRDLAERVRSDLDMERVRVAGDLEKRVRRIGFPWGGLGLSLNAGFLDGLINYGVDAMIAGETDDCAMRMVTDCGVPLIETTHATSENPGLRNFADKLRKDFPRLKVIFFENPIPWKYV